jgi:hypothetical protein
MRFMYRRALAYILLATFASGSILGEGLHLLAGKPGRRHHHCHHRGHWILASASHSRHGRHGDANGAANPIATSGREAATAATAGFGPNNLVFESDVCAICNYLLQAASRPADVSVPFDWQPLVFDGLSPAQLVYTPTMLSCRAPRGPPLAA